MSAKGQIQTEIQQLVQAQSQYQFIGNTDLNSNPAGLFGASLIWCRLTYQHNGTFLLRKKKVKILLTCKDLRLPCILSPTPCFV